MIVLDTKAAVAIAMGTDLGDALVMLRNPDERVIAPSFMHAEVAHVMSKYVRGGYLEVSHARPCFSWTSFATMPRYGRRPSPNHCGSPTLRMTYSTWCSLAERGRRCLRWIANSRTSATKTALMPFGSTAILGEDSLIQLSQYLRQLTRQNCPGNFFV